MQTRTPALALAITTAVLSLSQPLHAAPPATQPVADIPVKEVVLFSSGVGYFEHFGTVQGDGSTELRFKTEQINDILKSLVLQDLDGGKVAAVTYPSQDPIAKTLKSFQVDITANPPLADLLNQLRGAKVTLTVNGEKTSGVILGVERKRVVVKGEKSDDQTAWAPVLNLVSGGKIISQPLDAVNSIELDDPALQDELNKALIALAGAREQDKKPVKISFTGNGERHVRLGYVVETPIWKTSYRLILGNSTDKAVAATRPTMADGKLQGWAIVENQTDNDWNNVQLSLVSGRPISFVEDLYQPLYIPRPVVEPELFASLRPQTYADATRILRGDTVGAAAAPAAPPAELQEQQRASRKAVSAQRAARSKAEDQPMDSILLRYSGDDKMDAAKSVASVASAVSLGELFEYTVGSVSLPRQRSAMIPIITDPIEVERVSIYNQSVLARNPLNGARVKNTTKKHLLAGPITVIDGATYAGDAQIDNLPPGQERLLSYGVDLQMLVDAKDNSQENLIQTGKIVKGILYVTHKLVNTQSYVAENKSDHDKVLIVEHPRQAGWDLVDSPTPLEKTDSVYRFREAVGAGKAEKLTVKEQLVTDETISLINCDPGPLDFYRQQGQIPKPIVDALSKAIAMKQPMVDTQRQMDEAKGRLSDITTEQSRIRDNLKSVKETTQYYTRLMTKLNDQEDEIEKTQKSAADLQKQLDQERSDLEQYLGNLSV
jgi:hypothetical protein